MKIIRKSLKYIFIFFILISCTFALLFLFIKTYDNGRFYDQIFEHTPPEIEILSNSTRGIGSVPQNLEIKISDTGAGLDAYAVALTQKNRHIQLDSDNKLNGVKEKNISLSLSFQELKLTEGVVDVSIKAFDKSFWNNHKEIHFTLEVDARSPKLKVISAQHNLILNGVQLVIYQATDDNLKEHGVIYGDNFFQGFPINLLDESIKDENVFASFYSVESQQANKGTPRVIAKDSVGNTVTREFYNKKIKRHTKQYISKLSSSFTQIMSKRLEKSDDEEMATFLKRIIQTEHDKESKEMFESLHNVIFNVSLKMPFALQKAIVLKNFGSFIDYVYNDKVVAERKEKGTTFSLATDEKSVNAISDGVVIFVKRMKHYGNTVAVAHGGSVVAIYAMAGKPLVKSGDKVTLGSPLLSLGSSGMSVSNTEYLLEIRVNGYPVNPQEFFDNFWCGEHITGKLATAKEDLGLIAPTFNW